MKAEPIKFSVEEFESHPPVVPLDKACDMWLLLQQKPLRTQDETALMDTLTKLIFLGSNVVSITTSDAAT